MIITLAWGGKFDIPIPPHHKRVANARKLLEQPVGMS